VGHSEGRTVSRTEASLAEYLEKRYRLQLSPRPEACLESVWWRSVWPEASAQPVSERRVPVAAPASYLTNYGRVCHYLEGLKRGQVKEIARSPGGRPVHAVSYGEFEPVARTANLSSALAARKPEAFYGPRRAEQVLLVCSAVHGAEMESIAGVMNLISLMETGADLDGVEWSGRSFGTTVPGSG
jgi:hypothetical protein